MSEFIRSRYAKPDDTVSKLLWNWDYSSLKEIWFDPRTSHLIDDGLTSREKSDLIHEFTLDEIREHYMRLYGKYHDDLFILYTLTSLANVAGMNVSRVPLITIDIPKLTDSDMKRSRNVNNPYKDLLVDEMVRNLLQFESDDMLYQLISRSPKYKDVTLRLIQNENMPKCRAYLKL